MTTPTKWMKLAMAPDEVDIVKAININAHEFILFSSKSIAFSSDATAGRYDAYKYNNATNTFNKFITNENFNHGHRISKAVAFDSNEETFYICNDTNIHSHNAVSNIFATYKNPTAKKHGGYILFVNSHLHIIRNYNGHWICSIENNALEVISKPTNEHNDIHTNGAVIFIPSQQLILLIGGHMEDTLEDLLSEIWIYSLKTQKWTAINNISFKRYGFGYVLTSNERYIVLFGGLEYDEETDIDVQANDIFVVDMKDNNNWKIKKCKIKCPALAVGSFGTRSYGARTGGIDSNDQILVEGFIKQCFKLKEFSQLQLPPVYIGNIIGEYFSAEMIHCITNDNHHGIYLKHILASLYD